MAEKCQECERLQRIINHKEMLYRNECTEIHLTKIHYIERLLSLGIKLSNEENKILGGVFDDIRMKYKSIMSDNLNSLKE